MRRNFSDSDLLEMIRLLESEKLSCRAIAKQMNCGKSTVHDFLSKKTHKEFWENYSKHADGQLRPTKASSDVLENGKSGYVFTSAQNNTYVHRKFFESLVNYCLENNYQLVVSRYYYNMNGFQNGQGNEDAWFDPVIEPYVVDELCHVAKNLVFCGNLNIIPTAVKPLSGLESYTGSASGIVPHAKMQVQSLARHIDDDPRIMYTTGAVTKIHYIQQKAGQKAEWDHVYGAVVAEIDKDGDWYVRQLCADEETGEFYDLDFLYTPYGSEYVGRVAAINWGDLHVEKIDPDVAYGGMSIEVDDSNGYPKFKKVDNLESMLYTLNPMYQFFNDTADFSIRNHHNIKDPHFRFKMSSKGTDSVAESLKGVGEFLSLVTVPFAKSVVVESNHDLALTKWLKTADYKDDPTNAVFFLESQLAVYKAIQNEDENFHLLGHVLESLVPELKDKKVHWLFEGQSFKLEGIEFGFHGHNGPNGARGSINNLSKLGTKMNIGHSHSTNVISGAWQAGTSSKLKMGYNDNAPSSWSHSHIVTYLNGKRTIITMRGRKWCAM